MNPEQDPRFRGRNIEQDPEQALPRLRLARATAAAQIPSDEDFAALQDARRAAEVAQRESQKQQLKQLDERIAELESS